MDTDTIKGFIILVGCTAMAGFVFNILTSLLLPYDDSYTTLMDVLFPKEKKTVCLIMYFGRLAGDSSICEGNAPLYCMSLTSSSTVSIKTNEGYTLYTVTDVNLQADNSMEIEYIERVEIMKTGFSRGCHWNSYRYDIKQARPYFTVVGDLPARVFNGTIPTNKVKKTKYCYFDTVAEEADYPVIIPEDIVERSETKYVNGNIQKNREDSYYYRYAKVDKAIVRAVEIGNLNMCGKLILARIQMYNEYLKYCNEPITETTLPEEVTCVGKEDDILSEDV